MDDRVLAILGDREAAERLTAAGVLLECHCGGKAKMIFFEKRGLPSGDMGYLAEIKCPECRAELRRWALKKKWAMESATKAWNTRSPVLTPAQLELLKIGAEPRKFEEEEK